MTTPCGEKCKEPKDKAHICGGCGSCLWEVGFKQVEDDRKYEYPIMVCLGCKGEHFWD